jgi:ferritin
MISRKMEQAINEQINAELYSAYIYLAMSTYFGSQNLPGFANWMRVQTQEEIVHAMKFYGFVNDRKGRVVLSAIDKPPVEWKSPLDVFKAAYEHEQKITGMINNLVDLAVKEKDNTTNSFLKWFVDEQVEEEASADKIVQQLKLIKDSAGGLFILDKELGKRVFTPPDAEKE